MQEVENAGHDIDEQNNRAWQWRLKKAIDTVNDSGNVCVHFPEISKPFLLHL